MDTSDTTSILRQAEEALNAGDSRKAISLLQPLIEKKNHEALFLYSHLSIFGTETDEEFDERRIRILRSLSEVGYPPALYELGVCYDTADIVERSSVLASELYKKAAEAGYPKAKLSHGLDLYYGSNGITKNETLGLNFIRQAAAEKVEEADEILSGIEKKYLKHREA